MILTTILEMVMIIRQGGRPFRSSMGAQDSARRSD